MTFKVSYDKFTSNSKLLRTLFSVADSSDFGEKENKNRILDTEKEISVFLKLAEEHKDILNSCGYTITGNTDAFKIKRVNQFLNQDKNFSVLSFDRKTGKISEYVRTDGLKAKTNFDEAGNTKTTIYDSKNNEKYAYLENNRLKNGFGKLTLLNIINFGAVSKRLKDINTLSNFLML